MAASSDRLSWKETKPGHWEREIDEAEQCYTSLAKAYEGSGRTFFAMTGHISFSVAVQNGATQQKTEDVLRKAWIRLRYDNPTIASKVEYDLEQKICKKIYRTPSEKNSLHAWLEDTFRIISTGLSGIDWCNSDPPVPDLPTLFLIKSPASDSGRVKASIVLRCHHDIIDGMGTLHLFDNLFAHAARAYEEESQYQIQGFGREWMYLSPPFRVAADISSSLLLEQKAQLNNIISRNKSLKENTEIASVPFKPGADVPGKHQRIAITLSENETAMVMDACKKLSFSVTHVYHAAIAMAVRDLQERKSHARTMRYINYCLINERRHCKSPYNTPAHAASVYHSVSGPSLAIDLVVPGLSDNDNLATGINNSREEFLEIAKTVREYYLQIRDDTQHLSKIPSYWSMATIPYPSDGKTPPVPSPNTTPSVSISSMGKIDTVISPQHGVFDLEDPWVTGEELGTGLGLFLGTWKGRMTLSAAYNDAWHDRETVVKFVERCNWRVLGVSRPET